MVVVSPSVQPQRSQPHSVSRKGGKLAQGQKRKFEDMQRSRYSGPRCFGCGSRDHKVTNCPQRGEKRAVMEQRAVMEPRTDTRVCYYCRETGHMNPRCPKLQQMAVAAVQAGGQPGVPQGVQPVGWIEPTSRVYSTVETGGTSAGAITGITSEIRTWSIH
ncbi:PREDICTED: uncharacterized protein LOC104779151 [Camelina sativa]|uniref:Uncharacterized protein LOC104779151 n=1 Tax=Camelina sativa TaxID=90675 RepID=A0ABM0YJB2_CAMSA|nr:PREDICTED: uncharacterized protein LOC104779151 [Camelina sativa]